MKRKTLAALAAAALLGAVATGAQAFSGFVGDFNARYGSSRLSSCGLCHTSFVSGTALNPYGNDFASAGGTANPGAAFAAIESNDPDGDGFSSLAEITVGFFPGYNCSNYTLTTSAPADLAQFVEPGNPGCPVAVPDVDVSPTSLAFGSVGVGAAGRRTVTLRNLGAANLRVSAIALSGSLDFALVAPPGVPLVLAPAGMASVEVEYAPVNLGADAGTLTITSDDPDEPSVPIALTGTGVAGTEDCDIDVSPLALDFGEVPLESSAERNVAIDNVGGSNCTVSGLALDGAEFALGAGAPTPPFAVAPGVPVAVPVVYAPTAAADAAGSLTVASDDADEPAVEVLLAGRGIEGAVDLDIARLRVPARVFGKGGLFRRALRPVLSVSNDGSPVSRIGSGPPRTGSRPATLVGVQQRPGGDMEVYRETLPVYAGSRGSARFAFPRYLPEATGRITWTLTLEDDAPDVDLALEHTRVSDPYERRPPGDVDLDIERLSVTRQVRARRGAFPAIRIVLRVRNEGSVVGFSERGRVQTPSRIATLVGVQRQGTRNVEVHRETFAVYAGERGVTTFRLASFVPTAPGGIVWTASIADDDPDDDVEPAVSIVLE